MIDGFAFFTQNFRWFRRLPKRFCIFTKELQIVL